MLQANKIEENWESLIQLIEDNFEGERKEKLLEKKCFNSEEEIKTHIEDINNEKIKITEHQRMTELKNWLDYIGKK